MKILGLLSIGAIVVLLPSMTLRAYAEGSISLGNKAFGANRRVQTKSGYAAVSGTFQEPDFYVPNPNTNRSKPSFYLGCGSGDQEVDAGLQWESERIFGVDPGWAAFISNSHGQQPTIDQATGKVKRDAHGNLIMVESKYTNPRVAGVPWRVGKGALGSVGLDCEVLSNGGVHLALSGDSTGFDFNWNNGYLDTTTDKWVQNFGVTPKYVFPTTTGNISGQLTGAALAGMAVKRVVALTQQGASANDGSYSHNNAFSGGQVSKGVKNGTGELTYVAQDDGWPITSVDQPKTGYAPGGKDDDNSWIIDFDYTGMTDPNFIPAVSQTNPDGTMTVITPAITVPDGRQRSNGKYRDYEDPRRYPAETVHINLKQSVPVKGEPVAPGRQIITLPQ